MPPAPTIGLPIPGRSVPAVYWLTAPSVRHGKIRVGGRGRSRRRWSGSGIRGRGGGGGCSGSGLGKFPLPVTGSLRREAQRRSRRGRGSSPRFPPLGPQAPEATWGRGKGGTMEAGTEPPPSAAAAPPGLPRGAGCGHFSPRRRPWPPPPGASWAPERRVPPVQGVTRARRPPGPLPLPAGGPPRACPCRGRRRGTKRGRWRANPEPPGPPPAPGRGPSAPPAHMPAPRKLSQGRARRGAAAARPRFPAPTAARPARPERCRPEATQARGPQTPEPPPPPLPAASPSHTPPALPGSCRPLPGSQPVQQPPHASREESTGRGCARRPGFPPPAREPPPRAPPCNPKGARAGTRDKPQLPGLVLTSRPAPRAAASARLALRGSSPELSRPAPERLLSLPGTQRLPALPTTPPPQEPSPRLGRASMMRVAGSARPGSGARTQQQPARPARGSAELRAPRAAARVGTQHPPPATRHPRAPRGGAVTSGAVTPSGAGCRRR